MTMYRRSMLFAAIGKNDIQMIQSILTTDRVRLSSDGTDFYMLRESIKRNRKEITNLLLDHGCRASLASFIGDSPLHLIVGKPKCYSLVKRLLRRGANVNHRNQWTETPIQVAFASGAEDRVIQLLMKAYLKKNTVNETNGDGLSYLHIASAATDLQCVRKLVEEGGADIRARVNEDSSSTFAGSTPLHLAVEFGKTEVIQYLLEQGADIYAPDGEGCTAIHLALELGETDIIELLFEYDYKRENFCNDQGLSHFMAACACSGTEIAKNFLANRFKDGEFLNSNEIVDSPDNPEYSLKGFTPLHFAAIFGRFEMTKLLLADGANCCAVTARNISPKMFAERNGYQNIADLLKAHCHGYDWFFEG